MDVSPEETRATHLRDKVYEISVDAIRTASRLRKADTHTQRAGLAKEPQDFNYGVIFHTTPQPVLGPELVHVWLAPEESVP